MRIEKRFEAFPDDVLSLQMIENVSNAADLKAKIVSKLLSVEAAFLDADLIPGIFLVHLAAFKALSAQKSGLLLSNSLYTDLIVNISGGRHIAAALNTFGVGDTTTRLLVVAVNASEANWECLNAAIHGVRVPVSETAILGSEAKMKKAFKVSDLELTIGTIADAALCKGALNVR